MKNLIITIISMAMATALAVLFFYLGNNTTGVAIVYILAVVFIARYTDGYLPGIYISVYETEFYHGWLSGDIPGNDHYLHPDQHHDLPFKTPEQDHQRTGKAFDGGRKRNHAGKSPAGYFP